MRIFNSLTRKIEEIEPISLPRIGMYTCGPTVYDYPQIGNWRTYLMADWLVRSLKYLGFEVKYVMNLTDVGHLSGDNEGDADTGEDRLEKGARREGKTAWDVAKFYSEDFISGFEKLNLVKPIVFARATEHIEEQIALVKRIEDKGFSYRISDGIYFDTKSYEAAGNKYGELSDLDQIKAGARVEINPQKRDSRDFALWKFSPTSKKRDMEWESPWGTGFPGWHIECSAMSMKYLGEQFDIHAGGEDIKSTHHPNEIAQSEAATGKKPFVKYWVHGAFLTVDGGRMGKSLGNAYTLQDIESKGFELMDLRYFYLTSHYRKQLNFTWQALGAAREARLRLLRLIKEYKGSIDRTDLKDTKMTKIDELNDEFRNAIEDDLNMPQALAVVWKVTKSNITDYDKYDLLMGFEEVLGLNLRNQQNEEDIPKEIQILLDKRETLRREKKWDEADKARKEIENLGWTVEDIEGGVRVHK